jgi:HEAT repeat protein
MSILNKLASALGRNDEAPNQTLAKEIAEAGDKKAVRELVTNLSNKDKAIQSDCIKVLYEIGSIKSDLIADYVDDFVKVLHGRNNRLIWGAMTALGAIADQRAADIWKHIEVIIDSTEHGSVITQDWGIRVLAAVSAHDKAYEKRIFPFLMAFLQKCPSKDLPRHAASVMVAVNAGNRAEVGSILEARAPSLKPAQARRLDQIIRKLKR